MKELKAYNLSAKKFDSLLEKYQEQILTVNENIIDYKCGSKCKETIYYDNYHQMIILEKYLFEDSEECGNARNNWIQCICYRKEDQTNVDIKQAITGGYAFKVMKCRIMKYAKYTEDTFNYRMNRFKADYSQTKNQLHFEYQQEVGKIYKYRGCKKYDINGAYAKALTVIFPEAKDFIIQMYNERKRKPENKDLINYFVGMFCVKGYRKTYNWIVQNVRKQMEEAIDHCNGLLLYANTDGFAITCNENDLETSRELGKFKLEYEGDIYTYADKNYWVMQCGDKITGNALWSVRKHINLIDGETVTYDRITTDLNIVFAENMKLTKGRKIYNGN